MIAANLSNDIFGHTTTIFAHGARQSEPTLQQEFVEAVPPKRGFGKFFSPNAR